MITIRQMLSNISKGQSSIGVRYILDALNHYYDETESKIKIEHCSREHDFTRLHMSIPSATRNVRYDVVYLYHTTNAKITMDTEFRVYSNSPDFAYTFAYVYNELNALLYPEKYQREMIITPPNVRNPLKTKGFSKIIYATMKFSIRQNIDALLGRFANIPIPDVASFQEKNM